MSDALDFEMVNEAREVMQDKFPLMVEYFLEDANSYLATVETAITKQDLDTIRTAVHTMKSSSRQLGAIKLSALANEMENICIQALEGGHANFAQIEALFADLKQAFEEVEPALKKLA